MPLKNYAISCLVEIRDALNTAGYPTAAILAMINTAIDGIHEHKEKPVEKE